jgi:hypothetical protein
MAKPARAGFEDGCDGRGFVCGTFLVIYAQPSHNRGGAMCSRPGGGGVRGGTKAAIVVMCIKISGVFRAPRSTPNAGMTRGEMRARCGHDFCAQNTHGRPGGLKTQLGTPLKRQKQLGVRKVL